MLRLFLIVCKVSLREKTELMGFTLYLLRFTPLESPAACSGDEDVIPFRANTGFNAPCEPPRWKVEDFLTGFTCLLMLMGEWEMQNPNAKGLMIWTLIFGV